MLFTKIHSIRLGVQDISGYIPSMLFWLLPVPLGGRDSGQGDGVHSLSLQGESST